MTTSQAIRGLKPIFTKGRYFWIFLIFSFGFYLLNILISNFRNLISFYQATGFYGALLFIYNLTTGYYYAVTLFSFISTIAINVLTGILISLLFYKYDITRNSSSKIGYFSGLGVFLGILAPGCASCGVGLIALFGLSSTIVALPFQGKEISVIAIAILIISIYKISNNLYKCEIPAKKSKNRTF